MAPSQRVIRFSACVLVLLIPVVCFVDLMKQALNEVRRRRSSNTEPIATIAVTALRSRPPSANDEKKRRSDTTNNKAHQKRSAPQTVTSPSSLPQGSIRPASPSDPFTVHVLVYETESLKDDSQAQSLLNQLSKLKGIKATILGEGTGFEGYGSKYSAVYPMMKEMDPDSIVVISDSRDVLINNPMHSDAYQTTAVEEFRRHYEKLTAKHPGAIVVSAEAQCCVSALTYVAPGDYYNADGSRKNRACSSGEADCLWNGDDKAVPWENFMRNLAKDAGDTKYDDVYLNAGLIAGKARDLLRVIEQAGIGKDEDDQAVLTDFMHMNPDSIILDYGQKLFGNNRGGLGGIDDGSCIFGFPQDDASTGRLVHTITLSSPLFLHSPGGFFECQDELAVKLGLKVASSHVHRRLEQSKNMSGCNYGGSNYRNGCGADDSEDGSRLLSGVLGLDLHLKLWKNKRLGRGKNNNFWTRNADD